MKTFTAMTRIMKLYYNKKRLYRVKTVNEIWAVLHVSNDLQTRQKKHHNFN